MTDDTTTSTRPDECLGGQDELDAGPAWDIAELLDQIRQLPEPTQWLISSYAEALNEQRARRITRIEQQLEWVAGEIERLRLVLTSMGTIACDAKP
jgi:hypothetical protein